jgi:integrase/recombinase XerD
MYGLRDRMMLGIYYGCGLRCNEGLQLDVNDILIERGLLYVRKGKNFTERYVPMNTEIIKDVSIYLNEVRPQLVRKEKQGSHLFISQRGDRINAQSLSLRLHKLQQDSNDTVLQQKEIGLHTLRHSIATHLLMQGMKLERIAQFLGHKSIESTQIYTHLAHEL